MVKATGYQGVDPADQLSYALLTALVTLRRMPMADPIDRGTLAVLSELAVRGPSRPSALAGALRLDLSTISRHLRGLEDQRLVERSPDPKDARAHDVHVLPAGQLVLSQAFRARADVINAAVSAWEPSDREQLGHLLERLTHDFSAQPCTHQSNRKEPA